MQCGIEWYTAPAPAKAPKAVSAKASARKEKKRSKPRSSRADTGEEGTSSGGNPQWVAETNVDVTYATALLV